MILNFGELDRYVARSGYKEALKIIKGFSYQPAIEFFEDKTTVITFDGGVIIEVF